ncbi:hypothetical protein THMIRHAS_00800 [Thiosulfatimonas sediminis]|uniref:Gluconate 2-dehydrogenase subunit 3 family protein n=1 Tax=Thiosulfatimonas sediminis TaxID=2675054 RepID=A0A6F8PRP7_9GAMM|nr:gluconate 2-dehydrogenase subunit 3 family protein [Thiosulfatimonas sediminis]BBP44707.1 hypothetical protein THMIRHAS_00800 [Thiosulfatimonas sediminis]
MEISPFAQARETALSDQHVGTLAISRRGFLALLATLPISGYAVQSQATQRIGLEEPWLSVDAVQKQLFADSVNWVSAEQLNALEYLQQKMQRPLANQEDYVFLQKGVGWLNDFARSQHNAVFVELPASHKAMLLQRIAQSQAGENWLAMLVDNLIEALLSDPVYGGNPNGIGWKAMGQTPGYPLPQAPERYFELGYQRRQRDYQQRITQTTKG